MKEKKKQSENKRRGNIRNGQSVNLLKQQASTAACFFILIEMFQK